MSEMMREQVRKLQAGDVAKIFREAARKDREHEAITWEFGTDLVNIIAEHGDRIADAINKSAE